MQRRTLWLSLIALAVIPALLLLRKPLARHFLDRGIAARGQWRLADAERHLERALLLDSKLEDARIEAGIVRELRGEVTNAIAALRAVDVAAIDDVAAARRANALGTALFLSNQADDALREHQRALQHARAAHDRRLEAEAHIGTARVLYHAKGRLDESTRHLERALAIAREIGDEGVEAGALRHLAVVRWWLGVDRGPTIFELTQSAIAKYRRVRDLRGEATALSNLGMMHRSRRDLLRHMQLQNESLRIREQIGDRAGLTDSWSTIADMYNDSRNHRKGRKYLVRALETSHVIGYRLNENELEAKLADVCVRIGELDAAVPLLERVIEREGANPQQVVQQSHFLTEVHLFRGDAEETLRWAHRTIALARTTDSDPRIPFTQWMFVAGAEMLRGNLHEAERAVARADESAAEDATIEYRNIATVLIRAELMARLGRREEGLGLLTSVADEEIDSLQNESRFVWTDRHQWYDRLFRFLLGPDGSPALAARFLEQLRLRSLLNVLARGTKGPLSATEEKTILELEARALEPNEGRSLAYAAYEDAVLHSRLNRARGLHARPLSIAGIQGALDTRRAILEYIIAGGSLHAVVITRHGVRSHRLPVSSEAADTKIRLFRSLLIEGSRAMSWQQVAIDLRRVMIEPLESSGALDSIERLEIVPWGVLRHLPFAALLGSDGRFLVEEYVIEYAPSASAAARAREATPSGGPAMFFGLGRFSSGDLPPLPQAEAEAREISARVGGEVRLAANATVAELARVAPLARSLHFATHAVTEPDLPLLSRLVLAPDASGDGNLTIPEVLTMPLRADLVTLGACRSAESHPWSGRDESDLERVGLVEAFLHAGARAVLASLAPVGDRSTAAVMRSYYAVGVPSDPANRLAVTQRAMIRGEIRGADGLPLRHPKHWGAFVVFGGAP